VTKVAITSILGSGQITIDMPDGIITHLTRECGKNVHGRHIVEVTSGSFEEETVDANPHSGHLRIIPTVLQRMLLIQLSHYLIARRKKMFRTRGAIGCATVSRRGGLYK
jgi:hypothetical protein